MTLRQAQGERTIRTFADGAARLAGIVPCVLGWRPDAFWRATPAELAAIFAALRPFDELRAQGEREGGEPLTRDELARLMERDGDG